MPRFFDAVFIGAGATLLIDGWALFLRRACGVRSLDMCLLGRWVLYMPARFTHADITRATPKARECAAGWMVHYGIGIGFALLFVLLTGDWLAQPTLLPALAFGVVTVLVPFFTLQPALGLGVASSKSQRPRAARARSLATHSVFGVGLYLAAWVLSVL